MDFFSTTYLALLLYRSTRKRMEFQDGMMRGLFHQHTYIDYGARAFSQHRRDIQQITSANHHRTNTWLNSQILRKSKESCHPQTLVAKTGNPITTWRMDIYAHSCILLSKSATAGSSSSSSALLVKKSSTWSSSCWCCCCCLRCSSWLASASSIATTPASQIRWDGICRFSVASFARSSLY